MPKSEATLQTLEVVCTMSEPAERSCAALENAEGENRQTCTVSQKHRLRRAGIVNSEAAAAASPFFFLLRVTRNEFSPSRSGHGPRENIRLRPLRLISHRVCAGNLGKIGEIYIYSSVFQRITCRREQICEKHVKPMSSDQRGVVTSAG